MKPWFGCGEDGAVSDVGGSSVALLQVQTGQLQEKWVVGASPAGKQSWRTCGAEPRGHQEVEFPLLNPSLHSPGICSSSLDDNTFSVALQLNISTSNWNLQLAKHTKHDGCQSLRWETKCVKKSSFPPFLGRFWCWEKSQITLSAPEVISGTCCHLLSFSFQLTSPRAQLPSKQARWWQQGPREGVRGVGFREKHHQGAPLHARGSSACHSSAVPYFVLSLHQPFSQAFPAAGNFSFPQDCFVICLQLTGI